MFEYPDINFEDDEVKIRVTWLPPIDSLDLDYFEFQVFEPEKQKSGHLNRVSRNMIKAAQIVKRASTFSDNYTNEQLKKFRHCFFALTYKRFCEHFLLHFA